MEYLVTFDLDEWIANGLRQLEDLLLVHAAFRLAYPDPDEG